MGRPGRCWWLVFLVAGIQAALRDGVVMADEWKLPDIQLQTPTSHPVIACTGTELERLRAAYRGEGAAHDLVAGRVAEAETMLAQPVVYPPRGGQHNQWYQCDACQLALETVDDTHHRCPRCGTVYSGEPYDDVRFTGRHGQNLHQARGAAWAFAITGEERFGRRAAEILLGYADRYLKYPYHTSSRRTQGTGGGHILEQSLSEAVTLCNNIAPAFDLICDSPVLSANERAKIRDGLILPMLENIDRRKSGKSNWQSWHNAAMLTAGAAIGDASWVREALTQEGNGFVFQMENCVSVDGMWYENSWGYHFYALLALSITAENASRLGIDLWSAPQLRRMFTLPLTCLMPDGSLPRFGDAVRHSVADYRELLEAGYHAYGDPGLRPLLSPEPTWRSVLYGRLAPEGRNSKPSEESGGVGRGVPQQLPSVALRSTGHAILRTSGPAGLSAALTFSPFGGYHGHFDKLSFVFFGYEKELGVDPGRARSQAYRLPIHRDWYRATISHNTVVVDGASQQAAAGSLETFAANEKYASVVARCTEAYPDLSHRRLLVMTPAYLLVCDELTSTAGERRFDWYYHHRGRGFECPAAASPVDLSGATDGSQYIHDAREGTVSEGTGLVFDQEGVRTYLTATGDGPMEILTGTGPGESILDRVPLVRLTRRGTEARFAAVIEPRKRGEVPSVNGVAIGDEGEVQVITVLRGDARDVVRLRPGGGFEFRAGHRTVLNSNPLIR